MGKILATSCLVCLFCLLVSLPPARSTFDITTGTGAVGLTLYTFSVHFY